MSEDVLWIRIVRDGAGAAGDAAVPERLARSPLPGPASVEAGGRSRKVRGWSDPALAAVLGRDRASTIMTGPGLRADRLTGDELVWSIFWRPGGDVPADEISELFVDLCRTLDAGYGRVHLMAEGTSLYNEHYAHHERTFHASGLYWLNWFGPAEAARQGGIRALAGNPHAVSRAYGDALFVRVGDGPADDRTPAGRRRLLAATAALPPVPDEPAPDPAGQPRPERIDGQNGVRDPVDQSFWVNLHVPGGRRLPAGRIADIAALAGRGDPPVSKVHVLFSGRDAAQAHAAAFAALGARVWFVDDATGRPAPV